MNTIGIKVVDTIGEVLCISEEDGQIIFERIHSILKNGDRVNINFDRVCIISTLFLNTAIGKLYESFDEDDIRALVKVEGLSPESKELLIFVVDNAKKYYSPKNQINC